MKSVGIEVKAFVNLTVAIVISTIATFVGARMQF
jgi:hypothetical protein